MSIDITASIQLSSGYIMSLYFDNGRQGWVYVLANASMPGLYKIGATRKHPLQRAKELAAGTGVPTPFSIAYYRDYADCFLAETLVHERFESERVAESREFFSANLSEIVTFIDALPTSTEYKDDLASQDLTGGDYGNEYITKEYLTKVQKAYRDTPTPYAELFATFPDDGTPRELTEEEQMKCRRLCSGLL